jgi:hypothetical protein
MMLNQCSKSNKIDPGFLKFDFGSSIFKIISNKMKRAPVESAFGFDFYFLMC